MLQSKGIEEQMRKKVSDICQSAKGYKTISEALGHQKITVRFIIHKWRKLKNVMKLPRSGWHPQIFSKNTQMTH